MVRKSFWTLLYKCYDLALVVAQKLGVSSQKTRKSWDEYFMGITIQVSERGTCDRAKVGCVITKDNEIVSTGYNGSVSGLVHCDDVGHLLVNGHCVRTVHAEQNAIYRAKRSLNSATVYVTHKPCLICTKALLQNGVSRIVYARGYGVSEEGEIADELCKAKGVNVEKYDN